LHNLRRRAHFVSPPVHGSHLKDRGLRRHPPRPCQPRTERRTRTVRRQPPCGLGVHQSQTSCRGSLHRSHQPPALAIQRELPQRIQMSGTPPVQGSSLRWKLQRQDSDQHSPPRRPRGEHGCTALHRSNGSHEPAWYDTVGRWDRRVRLPSKRRRFPLLLHTSAVLHGKAEGEKPTRTKRPPTPDPQTLRQSRTSRLRGRS